MRILFYMIYVILLLWITKEPLTEATLLGIFPLPFMPPPKTTQKAPFGSTHLPPTRVPRSQVQVIQIATSTKPPFQEGQLGEFVKLHKVLEQTQQHTSFEPSSTDEKVQQLQTNFVNINELQNQNQQQPTQIQSEQPSRTPSAHNNQFEAVATNQAAQQKVPVYHHPVPLTFPPSSPSSDSSSSSDSYRLPRVISLPPLPQQQQQPQSNQHQSQQLPQSSSHYTTSSLSYSFAQGYNSQNQAYGAPPRSTKIVRHVSVFVAPPESGSSQGRQRIRVQGESEKHVNIIFIKSPDSGQSSGVSEIDLPPSPEQKTLVYVLNKAQEEGQNQVVVNKPEPPKYNPPDVFFIKYKDGQNQGGQQAYGAPPPPPQQQYGSPPPQQQPPQQSYGPPSQQHQPPQQSYGAPSQSPPQQNYGAPSEQQQTYAPPLQQQPQPPSEYGVAPSNQKFNYTLPLSSHSTSLTASLNGTRPHETGVSNNSFTINLSQNKIHSADRSVEEESHYHAHNLNYVSSHTHHEGYNNDVDFVRNPNPSPDANNLGQVEKNGQPGNAEVKTGLYIPFSGEMQSNEIFSTTRSNDSSINGSPFTHDEKHANYGGKEEKVAPAVLQRFASTYPTTTKTIASNTYIPTATPIHPAVTSIRTYNAIADIIGNIRVVQPGSKNSFSMNHKNNDNKGNNNHHLKSMNNNNSITNQLEDESNNSSGRSRGQDEENHDNDDIIILTKRNLTLLTSLDLGKEDEAKEGEKGSPRNISGRLDDFRTYQYAPSMDYHYFGVPGYKAIH